MERFGRYLTFRSKHSGPLPLKRDSLEHPEHGFCVRDGNYLSARWPGDAHRFALELVAMLR